MASLSSLGELVKLGRQSALLGDYARGAALLDEAAALAHEQVERCSRQSARVEEAERRDARLAVDKWRKVVKVLGQEQELVRRARGLVEPGAESDGALVVAKGGAGKRLAAPALRPEGSSLSGNGEAAASEPPPFDSWRHNLRGGDPAGEEPVWKQQALQHAAGGGLGGGLGAARGDRRAPAKAAPRRAAGPSAGGASGPGKSSSSGAAAGLRPGGAGRDGRKSYSEVMEGSADIELIRSIEGTIMTRDLQVRSEDIAGLQGAKTVLEEAVLFPQLMPGFYTGIRRPWKGVLLFGPPGTGKTMLAKAIASECRTCFFNVASSSLTSKWRGESEKMVSILFDMARYYAPSTIFFDEIDSIASARGGASEHEASRRVKSELLTQMDGVCNGGDSEKTVVVLAATNLPWDLDDALRRRLEKRIYVALPDARGREELFRLATRGVNTNGDVDFAELARRSEGYSGADISNVCHEASMMPIRRLIDQAKRSVEALGGGRQEMHDKMKQLGANQTASPPVKHDDFCDALGRVQSSVGGRDLDRYQLWLEEFGAT